MRRGQSYSCQNVSNNGFMRIVSQTPDRLIVEHRSWAVSIISLATFAFLAWVVWDKGALEGYFLVALPVLYVWCFSETCRIKFDRQLGNVRIFQKTMRQTARNELPLSRLLGAYVETQTGRHTTYRLNLGFENDGQRWHIPTHIFPFYRKRRADTLCHAINAWHDVATTEVKQRFPDKRRRLI